MPEDNIELEEKKERKKLRWQVLAACVVLLFYFFLKNSRSVSLAYDHFLLVIQPILIGFAMAFLMNPMMGFFEKRLKGIFDRIFKNKNTAFKVNRTLSTVLSLIILMGAIIFIFATIVPNLITTIIYLAEHIDEQIEAVLDWCNVITKGNYEDVLMKAKDNKIGDLMDQGLNLLNQYVDYDQLDMMSTITSSVLSVGKFLLNIIVGMFVSVYVLLSKETFKGQAKKLICGIFKPHYANIVLEISRKSGDIFYGFIIGKIIDSIVIGLICYACCIFMNMPYPVLVSVIVGVTNIVPVFGPYIGAVPTVIIIFLTEPMKGIYFLIFILILQQVDGNLIGPKILGGSTGISSFWVVFAVVLGAGFFGLGGMIIAVPIVAIIYYLTGRAATYMVRKRDLPADTSEYITMDRIDLASNTLKHYSENYDKEKKARRNGMSFIKKKTKK